MLTFDRSCELRMLRSDRIMSWMACIICSRLFIVLWLALDVNDFGGLISCHSVYAFKNVGKLGKNLSSVVEFFLLSEASCKAVITFFTSLSLRTFAFDFDEVVFSGCFAALFLTTPNAEARSATSFSFCSM